MQTAGEEIEGGVGKIREDKGGTGGGGIKPKILSRSEVNS
jgi:hypothetical protein